MPNKHFDYTGNRINYSDILAPDPDCELDFAVGMTYSADFERLLGVPISLGMFGKMDEVEKANPIYILEALRRTNNKLAIFCNAGCIKIPEKYNVIIPMFEQSLFQIALPKKENGIRNFHPKMWVIRYKDKDQSYRFKIIILSRNLTAARDFDVVTVLSGGKGKKTNPKCVPLGDMLRQFAKYANENKKMRINEIAKEVDCLEDIQIQDDFDDYCFLPFGVQGYGREQMLQDHFYGASKLFVISPFLTDGVEENLTKKTEKSTIITRRSSVSQKVLDVYQEVYATKINVIDDDIIEDEAPLKPMPSREVHAKIYYVEKNGESWLYVGSLNASANAFYNNVEFMAGFRCKKITYEDIRSMFLPLDHCPFERLLSEPEHGEGDKEDVDFTDVIFSIHGGTVTQCNQGYLITVHCAECTDVQIALFNQEDPHYKDLVDGVTFSNIPLSNLTEFFVLRRNDEKSIVKIPLENLPLIERDEEIINHVIRTKSSVYQYVTYLLDDMVNVEDVEDFERNSGEKVSVGECHFSTSEIYEKILQTSYAKPRKLLAIRSVLSKLKPEIVDSRLVKLVDVCIEATGIGKNGTKGFSKENS